MRLLLALLLTTTSALVSQDAESIKKTLQESANSAQQSISDTTLLRKLLTLADDMFKWNIEENDHAYLMAVDIPYPDYFHPKDYFSITVVKFKGKKRPKVISFAVSNMIDTVKGLSIYFAKDDGTHNITMSDVKFENIRFNDAGDDFVRLSADYMFLDKGETLDLFKPMLKNNHMIFFFSEKDGTEYKIAYPLLWFSDKLKELE